VEHEQGEDEGEEGTLIVAYRRFRLNALFPNAQTQWVEVGERWTLWSVRRRRSSGEETRRRR